jgi:hypothetical protein
MAALQGGLLLTQVRRDPEQLRIALDAARTVLRTHRVGSERRVHGDRPSTRKRRA